MVDALYVDACCHVGERGNEMIAEQIADALERSLRAPGETTGQGSGDGGSAPN